MTGRARPSALWLEHLAHERRASPAHAGGLRLRGRPLHRPSSNSIAARRSRSGRPGRGHRRRDPRLAGPPARRASGRCRRARSARRCRRSAASTASSTGGWASPNAAIALVRGPRVKPGAPRPVTEDQARGLLAEAGADPDREDWEAARDEAVLTLLYGCGLRISEALSLKRADAPLPRHRCASSARARKTRIVPVLPAVREAIDAYLAAAALRARARRAAVPRQARRAAQPAPRAGDCAEPARPPRPADQRHAARPAPLLRHPPAGRRRRPALDPGAARPRLALDHPALHRRSTPRRLLSAYAKAHPHA